MMHIRIVDLAGKKAENKDVARDLRERDILPTLAAGGTVTIDFSGVTDATQSFVHALISEAIRKHGDGLQGRLVFRSCCDTVRDMIEFVAGYMQNGEV